MKRPVLLIIILAMVTIGCTTKPASLTSQLKTNFSFRLAKVDSLAVIDSFRILGVDTLVEKLGKIIDDTIYIRQLHAVQAQLDHALTRSNKDSIEYFKGEIKYMSGQIDTLTSSIETADTKSKFGLMIRCVYQISKKDRYKTDSVVYFLDAKGNILSTDIIDSSVSRAYGFIK